MSSRDALRRLLGPRPPSATDALGALLGRDPVAKGKSAQEGDEHTWRNGKRVVKRGGKWIPVKADQPAASRPDNAPGRKAPREDAPKREPLPPPQAAPRTREHLAQAKRVRVGAHTYVRGGEDGWSVNGAPVAEEHVLREFNRAAGHHVDEPAAESGGPAPVVGTKFAIKVPKPLRKDDHGPDMTGDWRVTEVSGDRVRVSRHESGGPWMPKESLPHFVNDLSGRVVGPPDPPRAEIQTVLDGRATFLGKGDDGVVFKVGGRVVKVSTTVPYQPENLGHLTPEKAVERARGQHETVHALRAAGVHVLPEEFYEHGDKSFTVKPYVDIPHRFTREQLDQVAADVHKMHAAGYALRDSVQAGLVNDRPWLFDVGKAAKMRDPNDTGLFSERSDDWDRLAELFKKNGEKYVPPDRRRSDQTKFDELINRVYAGQKVAPPLIRIAHANLIRHLDGLDREIADDDFAFAMAKVNDGQTELPVTEPPAEGKP